MSRVLAASFIGATLLMGSAVFAQQEPTPSASSPVQGSSAPAGLPTVRHLVYRFGYNTKATKEGNNTGTTTVNIAGLANDGGMTINATDFWWMQPKPKQTYTCEVYPDGGVTCAQPPNALSAIQLAVVPLLGQNYFAPLAGGPNSSWKQTYKVRLTFSPGMGSGFVGQVYTWNCAYTLTGKGTVPQQPPLILVHADGQMKQEGGRYIIVNEKANILFDPRIHMPVYVDELITFVPRLSVNSYTIELKLIRD